MPTSKRCKVKVILQNLNKRLAKHAWQKECAWMSKTEKFSPTSNGCNNIWVRYEYSLHCLLKRLPSDKHFHISESNVWHAIPENPLYFRIGLHFFLFSPEHFEITKLLGWFWERAKYPKINPISAVVSGIPIPTKGGNV